MGIHDDMIQSALDNHDAELKQGSVKDEQEAVIQTAAAYESPYGIVQGFARMDVAANMKRGLGFDKAMQKAGLGMSASQTQENLGRSIVRKSTRAK